MSLILDVGYIKLHRSLLSWEWYDDLITKALFIHLLLTVSIKDDRWHGVEIQKGSRVCSYATLASETGLTINQIRHSLDKLKVTRSVTHQICSKFSVIAIVNWESYQGESHDLSHHNHTIRPTEITSKSQQYKKERIKEIRARADTPSECRSGADEKPRKYREVTLPSGEIVSEEITDD